MRRRRSRSARYGPLLNTNAAEFFRRRFSRGISLPRSLFQQSLLQLFLAFDAVPRPRNGFQALGIDFFSAMDAFAETAFADAGESFVDHLQRLPVVIALAEQEFLGVRTGRAVGDVLRGVFVRGTAIGLGAVHGAAQLLLPGL